MRRFILLILAAASFLACSSSAEPDRLSGLYIALGDSLSEGVGASDPARTAFVPLVHRTLGDDVDLMNLGVAGHTSQQLIDQQLDRAIREIERRNGDDDLDNDVSVITLEIGGNDLLGLFFDLVLPGVCPTVESSLDEPRCVDALSEVFETYERNLGLILDRLEEADPDIPLFLMTLYNPFSGGWSATFEQLADLTLEGRADSPFPEGLLDIVRRQGDEKGVNLVEVYPRFQGNARPYVGPDMVHPTDIGYCVMAVAVLESMLEADLVTALPSPPPDGERSGLFCLA